MPPEVLTKSINDKGIIDKHGVQRIIYRYLKRHSMLHRILPALMSLILTTCPICQ